MLEHKEAETADRSARGSESAPAPAGPAQCPSSPVPVSGLLYEQPGATVAPGCFLGAEHQTPLLQLRRWIEPVRGAVPAPPARAPLETLRRAAGPGVIRRKFAVVDTGTLLSDFEHASTLAPATVKKLQQNYGATPPEIDLINRWAAAGDSIAGSPFADYQALMDKVRSSEGQAQIGAPAPFASSSSSSSAPPRVSAPAHAAPASSPAPHGPMTPVSGRGPAPTGDGAAALQEMLDRGPNGPTLSGSGLTVASTGPGMFSLNGQLEAAGVFLAQLSPDHFTSLVHLIHALVAAGDGKLSPGASRDLRNLVSSDGPRLRPGIVLRHGLSEISTLGLNPHDPLFANMSLAERIRLYDIVNGAEYTGALGHPDAKRDAAQYAWQAKPVNVFDFVSKMSFYIQASGHLGLTGPASTSGPERSERKTAPEPSSSASAPTPSSTSGGTGHFQRVDDLFGQLRSVVTHQKLVAPLQLKLPPTDPIDEQQAIQEIAAHVANGTLAFGSVDTAADHVIKHRRTGPPPTDHDQWTEEARTYLKEARDLITGCAPHQIKTQATQTGGHSFIYEAGNGSRAVVLLAPDRSARIATYTSPTRA